MSDVQPIHPWLEPIRCSITVACDPSRAFEALTDRIGDWWPVATHSVWQADAMGCRMEPGLGGRLIETRRDGTETVWAEITAWEPPTRVVLSWHPGLPAAAGQAVEIRLTASAEGTLITLEHRDWQQHPDPQTMRSRYAQGWAGLFERELTAWVTANHQRQPSPGGARP